MCRFSVSWSEGGRKGLYRHNHCDISFGSRWAKEKRNNQWLLYYSGEIFAGACLFFHFFDILILPKILRFFLFSLDYASCYNGNCNDAA